MSKHIDMEWLKDHIEVISYEGMWHETETDEFVSVENINNAPSIDICFCKDCDFSEVIQNDSSGVMARYCRAFTVPMMKSDDDFCSYGVNSSEKPNNCEHITEDGVTCAKYPACDDCLDNPLNKVKGSERLVKGSEKPNNSND